jgi:hypothetical protein
MRRLGVILLLCLFFSSGAQLASATSVNPNNWSNATTISQTGSVTTGDIVGLWQAVLATRALLPSKCYQDGNFDTTTESGTEDYQTRFSVAGGSDGIVGYNTWHHARTVSSGGLDYIGPSSTAGYDLYKYTGDAGRTFYLIYGVSSTQWGFRPYGFSSASARLSYYTTDYPTVTFPAPPGC